jgi:choline dehydrogenase-like flavoprotein
VDASRAVPHLSPRSLPSRCSTLIVGAGLAGLEVARRLDEQGCSDVAVLEAGPAADLRHVNATSDPVQALRKWLEPATDPWFRRPWRSRTEPHYAGGSGLRQRLGGRSLYWYGITLPLEPWALRAPWWPAPVVHDLCRSWQSGPGLYARTSEELGWRDARAEEESPATCSIAGLHLRPTPRAIRRINGDRDRWYAYSPLDHWRDPVTGESRQDASGVSIHTLARVLSLVVADGRVRGARVESPGRAPALIRCDRAVLAGGTIENSRLIIQALHTAGELREARLGGLADHIVQGVFTRLDQRRAGRVLESLGLGSFYAPLPETRSNLFLDIQPARGGEMVLELQLTGEQVRSDASYVECVPSDRLAWDVAVTSRPSREDRALIAAQQELLREAWAALSALWGGRTSGLEFADYEHPRRTNAFILPESIRATRAGEPAPWANSLGTEDHEGGTLALGERLDEHGELSSLPGGFVVGPSTFPRLGAANPSLTTLALARRLAIHLTGA